MRNFWRSLTASPLRRQAVGNYALKIANMGLTFAGSVVLARVMGPEQFGVYSFAYSVLMILAIVAEFGLPTLVVRETAKGMARNEPGLVRGVWGWALKVSGTLSLLLAAGGGLVLLGGRWLSPHRLQATLWALAAVPLLALGDIRNAALRGLEKAIAGQLPEFLLRPALHLVFIAVLWLAGIEITGSWGMFLYLVAACVSFLTGLWLWYRQVPDGIFQTYSIHHSCEWRSSMLPFGIMEIMGVANLYVATVMQGFSGVPDADVGVFRIAQQLAQLTAFGLVINLVLGPRFAALYEKKDRQGLQKLAIFSARMVFLLFLVVGLFLVAAGKTFIQILFGPEFAGAYVLMVIMLAGQLVNTLVGSVGWILNMANYERQVAGVMSFSVLANIVLNGLLLPSMGIIGSAIAVSVSVVIWNVLLWWLVKKHLGVVSLPVIPGGKK